jgi:hypothetical protein
VHKPLDSNTAATWPVGNQVLFEFADAPNSYSGMLSVTDLEGRSHAGHFGERGVCGLDGFAESFAVSKPACSSMYA